MSMIDNLAATMQEVERRNERRERRSVTSAAGVRIEVNGRTCLNFSSNDYLGLANDARIVAAVQEGAERWGVGASASHLVCGHFAPHEQLEQELARWLRMPRALLFSTGYMANLGVVTALAGRGTVLFADRLNHASLNDAAILSRAKLVRYPHQDLDVLESALKRSAAKAKLICTDAVFSMDGDIAPLPELLKLAERFEAWLLVDDAHGFGVLGEGRGTPAHFGLHSDRLIYMGTLGKAAGVCGAFVAAQAAVVEHLLQKARTYIFTTAMPPLLACALLVSLRSIRDDNQKRLHLFALIGALKEALADLPWPLLPSTTAIQPLLLGNNSCALKLAAQLWEKDIWVPAIRPPTVPKGQARLRITLSAAHERPDIAYLARVLHEIAHAASQDPG